MPTLRREGPTTRPVEWPWPSSTTGPRTPGARLRDAPSRGTLRPSAKHRGSLDRVQRCRLHRVDHPSLAGPHHRVGRVSQESDACPRRERTPSVQGVFRCSHRFSLSMDWSAVAPVIPTCDRHGGKSLWDHRVPTPPSAAFDAAVRDYSGRPPGTFPQRRGAGIAARPPVDTDSSAYRSFAGSVVIPRCSSVVPVLAPEHEIHAASSQTGLPNALNA